MGIAKKRLYINTATGSVRVEADGVIPENAEVNSLARLNTAGLIDESSKASRSNKPKADAAASAE